MSLFHKPLIYVKWLGRLRTFILKEVFKLLKCYLSVKNFDRKPATSLKFVNEYIFFHSHYETQDKCILREVF